jgi:hypothetical protein
MLNVNAERMLFALGDISLTVEAFERVGADGISKMLSRHVSGDWGDVCTDDAQANTDAVRNGDSIHSFYKFGDDMVYVITEWDRSNTTVLMNYEY